MIENSIVEKFRCQIKSCLEIDDFVVDMLEGETYRDTGPLALIGKFPFLFYSLLALLSNILFPLKGLKRKVQVTEEDFLFISCVDTAFRTKTIGLIAGDLKYSIIFLPNFHIPTSFNYHYYFKEKGIRTFFPTIHFKHVMSAKRKVGKLMSMLGELDGSCESKKMISVISNYVIYDEVVKNFMANTTEFRGKWILEHQKFYFMSSVANLHARGIPSTMLQHGIFFKPVYDFIPLFCDKVLCCSEREKLLYIENGTNHEQVEVFGAPLQTLQQYDCLIDKGKHYDILVMMTLVNDKNVDLIKRVLVYIKQNYNSVLVRLRPRSRRKDKALLTDVLAGLALSKSGTPICEDILSCDKVVSFSVDANIEVTKFNKPFIYIWDQEKVGLENKMKCATAITFEEEIKKMMTEDFYSTLTKEQYVEILGETDVKILRERFKNFVTSTS